MVRPAGPRLPRHPGRRPRSNIERGGAGELAKRSVIVATLLEHILRCYMLSFHRLVGTTRRYFGKPRAALGYASAHNVIFAPGHLA